jgi:hypothetical protein
MAVSPKASTLTILPPRKVDTSASGADSPPAVTWVRTTTTSTSSSARKRLGSREVLHNNGKAEVTKFFAKLAICSADRAVSGQDKLDVVVEGAQDCFEIARGERVIRLLGYLDILTCYDHSFVSFSPGPGFPPRGLIFLSWRDLGGDCSNKVLTTSDSPGQHSGGYSLLP